MKLFGTALLIILLVCLTGSLCGLLLYLIAKPLLGLDWTLLELARKGLFNGAFFALIWAPGIAIVSCIMIAKKKSAAQKQAEPIQEEPLL